MNSELAFLKSIRDGDYFYYKDIIDAIFHRIEYLEKEDALNTEEKN